MDINSRIEQAKKDILSDDWKVQNQASNLLSENSSVEIREFLISLLNSIRPDVRNVAALTIRDIKDDDAVISLFAAIFKKENYGTTGTFVYALQTLNCSKYLKELFQIIFHYNYEPQVLAGHILEEQQFIYTKEDIAGIVEGWNKVKENKKGDERVFIQDIVDRFSQF